MQPTASKASASPEAPGEPEELDAVVIGANLRGLVSAWVLNALGYRAVLLERSPRIGGADGSFVTAGGNLFDHGLHLLDSMRSELATRLFTQVVGGAVHELTLQRAIVLRGQLMPYAPQPAEMPAELRAMLPPGKLVDDLGDELPTRERLASCYGRGFTDLIFDEVLPSFACESRHREFGVDEARLLTNVYPWFFPRARRKAGVGDASRVYHDRLRAGIPQQVLYPRQGGFGGFAEGLARALDPERVELVTGASDLHVELRPGTHSVEWVSALGRRFRARRYFWAAAWEPLCKLLDIPCQQVASDQMVLGSFRFDRPARTRYHEILVGDPDLRINRISFPAAFRLSDEPLMQVEYAFPRADEAPLDHQAWKERWLADARRLGLLDGSHRVEEFDFRTFPMHYNAFGVEGEPLRDADPALIRAGSNLVPVVPSMANLNTNAYVPRVVAEVTAALALGGR